MTGAEREAIDAMLKMTELRPGEHPSVDFDAMDRMYRAIKKVREERRAEGRATE